MVPLMEIIRNHPRSLAICIGMVLVTNVTYYMLLTYMPTYMAKTLGYTEDHGALIIVAVMVGMLFVQPLVGFFSDRIGRRPFLAVGSAIVLTLSIPAFHLIASGQSIGIFFGLLILAIGLNCLVGILASTLPALFPTRIRYSALAMSFNISIVVAGLTPTVTAWLVEATDNIYMPAYYLMIAAAAGLVTTSLPEGNGQPPTLWGYSQRIEPKGSQAAARPSLRLHRGERRRNRRGDERSQGTDGLSSGEAGQACRAASEAHVILGQPSTCLRSFAAQNRRFLCKRRYRK